MTAAPATAIRPELAAVLFDRDGTLVHDVPYNGDPALVRLVPGATHALARTRAAGLRTGILSNQSGIGRGLITAAQVAAVNARVVELVGPIDTVQICPHTAADGCDCRKPAPGMVLAAARELGVAPAACAVIGDIGADVGAAAAAGAIGVLVPTPATRAEEVAAAALVAGTLDEALDLLGVPPLTGGARVTATLAVRLDSDGDVLITGPALRQLATTGDRLDLLVSPAGAAAGRLLPDVDAVLVFAAPWTGFDPPPVDPAAVTDLVERLRTRHYDRAVIFTSFHQSPLPMALLLRLAGIGWIGADSVDYPGSLLDLRHHRVDDGGDRHEVLAALDLAHAVGAGGVLPGGPGALLATSRLAVRRPLPDVSELVGPARCRGRYVVVHPGASVPARAPRPADAAAVVSALRGAGWPVVVTGGPGETALTGEVAAGSASTGSPALDLGGRTDLAQLAGVLDGAACVVVGNTGPAHLAAAVGTPVVSLFAPVVPAARWAPWGVPTVLLGDSHAPCRDTRARRCPVPGHPCLSSIDPAEVVAAVGALAGRPEATGDRPGLDLAGAGRGVR